MHGQLKLAGFDFTEEELREAYERSRSNVRHELTFEQAMKNEAVRKCLAVELQRKLERAQRGRHGHYKRYRSHV